MLNGELVQRVKAAAAGLSHGDREGLGLALASAAAGEEVQFFRCERGTMTAWIDSGASEGVRLTDADRAYIRSLGRDPDEVAKHMPTPSSDSARREQEVLRLKAAEVAGPLTASETATMKQLKAKATVGTLDPDGQRLLLGLLDRHLAARGGGR